jgi:hypothetical protein
MTDDAKGSWQKLVSRWRASGESAATFSAREGIRARQLYHWASKLRVEERGSESGPVPVRMMQLVRVPSGSPGVGIIIDVPDTRARVMVEPGFDRGTLAVVLEMLGIRSAA